jgi:micrococcal nuclease
MWMNFIRIFSVMTSISISVVGSVGAHAAMNDGLSATFSICSGAPRKNCVVDGDTFWFRGQKIRIADIDTPELSPSRCAHDAKLGKAAKYRLLALLNAGQFSLASGSRDEDRNGRKLRTVLRKGSSIGSILVAEGLARPWDGHRRGWCG